MSILPAGETNVKRRMTEGSVDTKQHLKSQITNQIFGRIRVTAVRAFRTIILVRATLLLILMFLSCRELMSSQSPTHHHQPCTPIESILLTVCSRSPYSNLKSMADQTHLLTPSIMFIRLFFRCCYDKLADAAA